MKDILRITMPIENHVFQISFFFKSGLRYCFRYSLGCFMRFRHGLRMLSRFLPLLICFMVVSLCV